MKGLELAKRYYEEVGLPMLRAEFGAQSDRIAAGLAGHGSECFGFDDELSRDHDFAPGFCLWLTEEDERDFGFALFRAYRRLPEEFCGIRLQKKSRGAVDRGVMTVRDFYRFYTGTGEVPGTLRAWLSIPDFYLSEATNGQVFRDPVGEFSRIREALLSPPEDVTRKKLADRLFHMAQTGQYNYTRCLAHGEKAAAVTVLSDFCKYTAGALHILSGKYAPYYKWLFRSLSLLPGCAEAAGCMEKMLADPCNEAQNRICIESLCALAADRTRAKGYCMRTGADLEPYAYEVNAGIRDGDLRTMDLML